jgi:hypothetical protein
MVFRESRLLRKYMAYFAVQEALLLAARFQFRIVGRHEQDANHVSVLIHDWRR